MGGLLLRLMFTASVVGIGGSLTSFAVSFLTAEVISLISGYILKEGAYMIKFNTKNRICFKNNAVKSGCGEGRHFRLSLLMSL